MGANQKAILAKSTDKWLLGVFLVVGISVWGLYPDSFIPEDAFFYLVIARNMALTGSQTFSDIAITNGVHPLWTYLLSGYSYLISLFDPSILNQPLYVVPLSSVLFIGGILVFWRVGTLLNLPPLPIVILPAALLLGWSVLGSEAIFHFFLLSILLFICSSYRDWNPLRCCVAGLICACVILARLDSAFVVAAFFFWHFYAFKRFDQTLVIVGICCLVVFPYLIHNYLVFGSVMPISGWIKGTFPEPCLKGFMLSGKQANVSGYSLAFGIIPIFVGLLSLTFRSQMSRSQFGAIFTLLVGSVMQFFYVAVFTSGHTLWHWYYIAPIMLLSLAVCTLLVNCSDYVHVKTSTMSKVLAVIVLVGLGVYYYSKHSAFANWPNSESYRAIRYVEDNKIKNQTIFVSDWPGYLAFFAKDNRILAADMYTSNRVFYDKMTSSDNALQFLMTECQRQGKPIKLIFWWPNPWLVPDSAMRKIVYNDPKRPSKKIGELVLPEGTILYQNGDDFICWKLP
jgi:hypothetical protein